MTQEEKDLLLKDLCARLPYGVMIYLHTSSEITGSIIVLNSSIYGFIEDVLNNSPYEIKEVKPYLRPMSSMTEEEKAELYEVSGLICYDGLFTCKKLAKKQSFIADTTVWLNSHHFDYYDLIPMGLAIPATEGMYKIN